MRKYRGYVAPLVISRSDEYATMQQPGSGTPQVSPIAAALANPNQVIIPIPTRGQLDAFNVNREGWEGVTQTLYDSVAYPAAGLSQIIFFQIPAGQGTGFAGGAKTFEDTNITNAGMLPANIEFLIQSIELMFLPTTPTVAAQMPAAFGAQAIAQIVNDAYIFYRTGYLVLFVGSKAYLTEAPLMKFPPKANFAVNAALADVSSTAASLQSRIAYGTARGRPYLLKAPLRLVSNQNFNVNINFPSLRAITNPALIYCTLDGVLYRRSQ